MKTVRRVFRMALVLPLVVAALLLAAVAAAPGARAADSLDTAAASLRNGPVYVDPRARDILPRSEADALSHKIEKAGKPVFAVALPAAEKHDRSTLLQDLRTKVGVTGVYAVALGDRFDAGADRSVLSRDAVENLTGAAQRSHPGDSGAMLTDFVDQAVEQAKGDAPATWDNGATTPSGSTGALGLLITLGVLVVVGVGGTLLVSRRVTRRRQQENRARLEELRPVVDEDITAFGEELTRIGFDPSSPKADDAMREDYTRALDSYEHAKTVMEKARSPREVRDVTEAVEDGRFSLATLEARMDGKPLPERRPPCFFDPRHGPSVEDRRWTPAGSTSERTVPVCAADAARLDDGEEPMAREVDTPAGRRPYWDAGPAYGPWASGYFGGALLPGLLVGTLLGTSLGSPYAYGDYYGAGPAGDYSGGDHSGGDFDPGDFGGDFGGGFGGGDFGGG
ncbi:hypothetical protein [Streptomyces himastatinicus]|uniref:hypothetical protein n=1 Tax=Streptomyces himastatinicus TaxID=998084 RepID=UPI0002E30AB3|nr:hypothetical protein [Streptomyces himastatinicus]